MFPNERSGDLGKAGLLALAGALVAGGFGIVHDQVTYTISPEYFTGMKFDQFRGADFGLPARVFVAEIGFLGTWWAGLIGTWFLARVAIPRYQDAGAKVMLALLLVGTATVFSGVAGGFAGPVLLAHRTGWNESLDSMGISDRTAFLRVAGIHLGSYAGALLAWIVVMIGIIRKRGAAPPQTL